jgi:hypothetical protein
MAMTIVQMAMKIAMMSSLIVCFILFMFYEMGGYSAALT